MKLFKRGQKGFTLVELMVVVGILAVLMSIVVPAVTGTKSTSIGAQVQSDADATQKAMDNFQNKGITPLYPEEALATNPKYSLRDTMTLIRKNGTTIIVAAAGTAPGITKGTKGTATELGTILNYAYAPVLPGAQVPAYYEIVWLASTRVWQSDGTVNDAFFVPDFLLKEPSSVGLDNDEGIDSTVVGTKLAEFLWLVKVNNPGSQDESRTLEVYRLTDSTSSGVPGAADDLAIYTQIY
ncbi:MAG: prepilin-type N-terminal cleavage/methylation domain-containing protein [Dehalococcoidia bacterium]|nr:prepilin-type N-terminal cleavage/methylation domain-containing protein [Dehalococcoidia bacterium]